MTQNTWSEKENDILLHAIENGTNIEHVVEIITTKTLRSENSVRRRVVKVGYFGSSGQKITQKKGFVG